jgi:hypothetical protein
MRMLPSPKRRTRPNPTSWNMYAYVNGDPVNFNDRRGLFEGGCPDEEECVPGGGDDCGPFWDNSCGEPCGDSFLPNPACADPGPPDLCPSPARPPAATSCDISVAFSGTLRDVHDVRVGDYPPLTNSLGPYSTTLGAPGWYFAVQIQGDLFGDTNPTDWNAWQSATVFGSGVQSPGGRFQTVIMQSNDSPSPFAIWTQTPDDAPKKFSDPSQNRPFSAKPAPRKTGSPPTPAG